MEKIKIKNTPDSHIWNAFPFTETGQLNMTEKKDLLNQALVLYITVHSDRAIIQWETKSAEDMRLNFCPTNDKKNKDLDKDLNTLKRLIFINLS